MTVKLAVIIDPLDTLKSHKDTSIEIISAALAKGWHVSVMRPGDIYSLESEVCATLSDIQIDTDHAPWYQLSNARAATLDLFDVILMRQDPPVDETYIYITHLLSKLSHPLIVNDPRSVRDCNEKLFAGHFPQLCPPTLVTSNHSLITDFHNQYQDIVIKPLNGLAGRGVFRVKAGDLNLKVICEELTQFGAIPVVSQKFIPDVIQGDKRIILIDGEPMRYGLLRVPAKDSFRANLAAGGTGKAVELTPRELFICQQLRPELRKRGLIFVGIDVIGEYLTEINITSPTGVGEIMNQKQFNIAEKFIDVIQNKVSKSI